MSFFKKLIFFLSIIMIASMIYFLWSFKENKKRIHQICDVLPETKIERVIEMARELGFKEKKSGALPYEISLLANGVPTKWDRDQFLKNPSGTVRFGKTLLPPFLRHYCQVEYANGKVVETKKFVLD